MRGKDAQVIPHDGPSYLHHEEPETEWKNGRPVRYTRATYDNYVRSIAYVDGQTLDYLIHYTRNQVTLPNEYEWHVDENGLCARDKVRTAADYHVDASWLLAGADAIVQIIESNRERREQLAAERAIERAKMRGVYVGIRDSVRAGNCEAGTRQFASRHKLDPKRRYPAEQLFELANGNADRVRIAIAAAVKRHKQELEQGYCEL